MTRLLVFVAALAAVVAIRAGDSAVLNAGLDLLLAGGYAFGAVAAVRLYRGTLAEPGRRYLAVAAFCACTSIALDYLAGLP
jgi:hypothetical protein